MTSPTIPVPTETVLDERKQRAQLLMAEFEGMTQDEWTLLGLHMPDDMRATLAKLIAEHDARSASPALASPVPSDAGVMGLVWTEPTDHPHDNDEALWVAPGLGGRYSISEEQPLRIGGRGHLLWWAHDEFTFAECRTVDEAKAAAQADFESRIRSCLVPSVGMDQEAVAGLLADTGCTSIDDLRDKANIGVSLMERIADLCKPGSRHEYWAPMNDPAEIVFDLANEADDERTARIALEAQVANLTAALRKIADGVPKAQGSPPKRDATALECRSIARAALPTPPASQGDAFRDGGEAV